MRKIRSTWSTELPVWHSIHLLGTICHIANLRGTHFIGRTCRSILFRWGFVIVRMGIDIGMLQRRYHHPSTDYRYALFGHQIVGDIGCDYGPERWHVGTRNGARSIGELHTHKTLNISSGKILLITRTLSLLVNHG